MIKQYPSETPDSFQGDKDINSAVITHGFAVLESISYYSSGEFSWIDKRVFEINKDGASYLHSIGSNIRNPKTTRGKCKLLTGLQ